MTVTAMTELEAVNIMLRSIAETPVTTLDVDTIEDAQIALSTLREVSRNFQAKGWHFNTDYNYPLSTDGNDKIPYPTTAAHCDPMTSEGYDLVKRGGFFWDRENLTFTFTGVTSIKFKIVWMFDFEDLPQLARNYIAMVATRKFAQDIMGDEATVSWTSRDEQLAHADFVADDLRRADLNMLNASNSVNRAVRRRSPWPA